MGGVEWPGYEAPSRGEARSSRPLAAAMAVIVGLLEEERRARREGLGADPSVRSETVKDFLFKSWALPAEVPWAT